MSSVTADGAINALVARPPRPIGGAYLLTLTVPASLQAAATPGSFVLVRCGAQTEQERAENWHFYARSPLFIAGRRPGSSLALPSGHAARESAAPSDEGAEELWEFVLLDRPGPAQQWLLARQSGERLNLLGPLGQGFRLAAQTRRLLLLSDSQRVSTLLPLADAALDQGGRVTLLVNDAAADAQLLMAHLPLAIEVRMTRSAPEWRQAVSEAVPWADQLAAALSHDAALALADQVRTLRMRPHADFAQALVEAELVCGYGACLACVVSLRNGGLTRACVHGPVMNLLELG